MSTSIRPPSSFFSSSRSALIRPGAFALLLFVPLGYFGKPGIVDLAGHMAPIEPFMVDIHTTDNYAAIHFLPLISGFFLSY